MAEDGSNELKWIQTVRNVFIFFIKKPHEKIMENKMRQKNRNEGHERDLVECDCKVCTDVYFHLYKGFCIILCTYFLANARASESASLMPRRMASCSMAMCFSKVWVPQE